MRQLTFFWIFPALMQPVQTCIRFGVPSTMARMRWMFGFHRRLVRRCEWLTFMPKLGCFPQISQTAAMTRYLRCIGRRSVAGAQDPERVLVRPFDRQPRWLAVTKPAVVSPR